jgi:hypothetical protein
MRNHLAAFAVAISICGQAAWATNYTIDTYDFPGAATTGVTGINAADRIVGNYTVSGTTTAGLFGEFGFTERNGIYTSVGDSLPCRPSGRCRTGVKFLNNFGLFAGAFSGDVDFPGAFSQSVNSAPAVVQPPEYPNTDVLLGGLNDLGEGLGSALIRLHYWKPHRDTVMSRGSISPISTFPRQNLAFSSGHQARYQ